MRGRAQRIHAPCIRVRERAERSYFLYCPPKTRDDAANTRVVYSGAGTRGEKLFSLLSTKTRDNAANTLAVYSGAGTRGEKLLSLLFIYRHVAAYVEKIKQLQTST